MWSHSPAEVRELLRRRQHRPIDLVSVLVVLVVPTVLFAAVYWICGFWLRYHYPVLALVLGIVPGLAFCAFATNRAWQKLKQDGCARSWISLAIGSWVALLLSLLRADMAYWSFKYPFYMYKELADYVNIDPSLDRGQAYMDAGQVYFKENSYVDTSMATAYRSGMTFCVAPIVRGVMANHGGASQVAVGGAMAAPESGTLDWWAVGTNCCDLTGKQFACGAMNNSRARSGLRLIREDIRPFFRLAVQEVSAALDVPAKHPLFFYWVQDPLGQVDELGSDANSMYWSDLLIFFLFNICLTFLTLWLLHVRKYR